MGNQEIDEQRVADAVTRLSAVHCGCIDACTIIYAQKAGYFDKLAATIRLMSTPGVPGEVSRREPTRRGAGQVRLVRIQQTVPADADEEILCAAARFGVPVLSDDRRVIRAAKAARLDCFNAAMLLHLLFLRRVLDVDGHRRALDRLLAVAWYGPRIRAFADACYDRIRRSL